MYDYFETEYRNVFVREDNETGEMEISKLGSNWLPIEPIMPDTIGSWTPLTEEEYFDIIESLKSAAK